MWLYLLVHVFCFQFDRLVTALKENDVDVSSGAMLSTFTRSNKSTANDSPGFALTVFVLTLSHSFCLSVCLSVSLSPSVSFCLLVFAVLFIKHLL